jgi:hypothetical protein
LALALVLPAHAQDKWGPHVDVEAKPGSKRSLAEADLFLPLSQDAGTLWFANLRTRFDNRDGYEGNLGLGVRRMLESGWNLGAYAYADRRRSELGNTFDQATFGLEALGRDFELRGNVYAPLGSRARDIGTISTASISGASVQVSTAFREERALKGYDAEAGWRLPVWDAEAHRQLRIYLGGYRFADAGISVNGPRARVEFAVQDLPWFDGRSSLFVGAETQHDSARGTNNFAYVRLRIPLGKSGGASPRLTAQERRMTAPVVRDIDIVTQAHTRATLNETASATANGQPLTVIDGGSTTGAALPGAVAAAGANSTVLLTGTFNTTASTTLQAGQTVIGAGNLTVRTPSGQVANLATPGATINGVVSSASGTVTMGVGSTLTGMTITNFGTAGNPATGVRGATNSVIEGNTISTSASGLTGSQGILLPSGSTNLTVRGNTIFATGTGANGIIGINVSQGGGRTALLSGNNITVTGTLDIAAPNFQKDAIAVSGGTIATITGNTMNVSGAGLNYVIDTVNSVIAAGSTGNVRVSGGCSYRAGNTGVLGFTDGTTCP